MDYGKLSPTLAVAVDDFAEAGRPALVPHVGRLGFVSVEEQTPKPPRVVMFLRCDETLPRDAFADLGVELNQGSGSLRTGIVPVAALSALTDHAAVHRVVPARRLKPLMDKARPRVGIPAMWDRKLSGKGVVIGVIDSGIDVSNPAFEKRVLRVWDQTLPGPGVAEGGYGAELKGDMMQIAQDTVGHGTHVSGMAAGHDPGDPTYAGVAPKANLIVVKTDALTAHVADGIRYVFRVAGDLKRPAVVNISLGSHDDAHDGTDALSQVIDAAAGPGRIVCCAAGNDGNNDIHAQVQLPTTKGATRTITCAIPPPAQGQPPGVAVFNGWYAGTDSLEVGVVSPSGKMTPYQGIITEGSPAKTYSLANGSVRVTTPGPDPTNHDVNFVVEVTPAPPSAADSKAQSWKLRFRGVKVSKGTVDVWSIDGRVAQFTGPAAKDAMKIGSPGCARRAITVAAFTTRTEWDDMSGGSHETGEAPDTISDFSSEGPLRNGDEKPDVTAPGSMIICSLSSHSPVTPDILIDPWNRVMEGTSMACPFVAGTVALLLQRDKTLTPEQVKDLLKAHSSIPGKPAGTWDAKWGYGLLDATKL
jgi:subtilisin family serine protease